MSVSRITTLVLGSSLLLASGCATWQNAPRNPSWASDALANQSAPQPVDVPSAKATPYHVDSPEQAPVVRYQTPGLWDDYIRRNTTNQYSGGSDHFQQPMQPSGAPAPPYATGSTDQAVQPAQYNQTLPPPSAANGGPTFQAPYGAPTYGPSGNVVAAPGTANPVVPPPGTAQYGQPAPNPWGQYTTPPANGAVENSFLTPDVNFPTADIIVNLQETQTGRLMIGAAVNSDAGVTGQIVIDEKNFDWRRVPTSLDDWANGTAFRGAGQGFRLEAMPGREVQRYMLQFTEPYLFDTRISFNLSAFLFDRNYFDWDEERAGGRIGFGYRITPDMSVSAGLRAEQVTIDDIRVPGIPDLDEAEGRSELYGLRFSLTQDTRDIPFAPTQGYFFEASFEQIFGTYDYSRGTIDFRRYFLVTQRPDGSGRHVLGFSSRVGFTGSQTPIFERFYAGGYATLRGFDFRGATPKVNDVAVGGELSLLGSVEYLFPITADDMLKGIVFCDYGTIEEEIKIDSDDYRVALGAGLRIFVPAMGPAPIALDFAVPVAREDTDDIRQFSFFMGVSR